MKDKDDCEISSNDQKCQQDNHGRLKDADIHRAVVAKSKRAGVTLGHVHNATAHVHDPPVSPLRIIHGLNQGNPQSWLRQASALPSICSTLHTSGSEPAAVDSVRASVTAECPKECSSLLLCLSSAVTHLSFGGKRRRGVS